MNVEYNNFNHYDLRNNLIKIRDSFILNCQLHNKDSGEKYEKELLLHEKAIQDPDKNINILKAYYFAKVYQVTILYNNNNHLKIIHDYRNSFYNNEFLHNDEYFFKTIMKIYNAINTLSTTYMLSKFKIKVEQFLKIRKITTIKCKDYREEDVTEELLTTLFKKYEKSKDLSIDPSNVIAVLPGGADEYLTPIMYFDASSGDIHFIKNTEKNIEYMQKILVKNIEDTSRGMHFYKIFTQYSINSKGYILTALEKIFDEDMGENLIKLLSTYELTADETANNFAPIKGPTAIKNINDLINYCVNFCEDSDSKKLLSNFVQDYTNTFKNVQTHIGATKNHNQNNPTIPDKIFEKESEHFKYKRMNKIHKALSSGEKLAKYYKFTLYYDILFYSLTCIKDDAHAYYMIDTVFKNLSLVVPASPIATRASFAYREHQLWHNTIANNFINLSNLIFYERYSPNMPFQWQLELYK